MRSIPPYEFYGEAVPVTDTGLQVYVFKRGDTITGIAHKFYGDVSLWRLIADRNSIYDPRQMEVGTELLIPELPAETGRFQSL
jgi:nucleoid-associated protein YgaU